MPSTSKKEPRILYSFPHKLGADRICYTAWQQVNGIAKAGANVLAFPGVLHKKVHSSVEVKPTLAIGKFRISYKLFGTLRCLSLHDRIVAKKLKKLIGKIDIIHLWPASCLETLKTAKELKIPTVLERPNAHTRFAFQTVAKEFERLGILLPPSDEYYYNESLLKREEEEYKRADYILCPSNFTVKTFIDQGIPQDKLVRHIYGFDEHRFFPSIPEKRSSKGLNILFVGVCAVRKGVHFALEAWLKSPASKYGKFRIAGEFLPEYAKRISSMLSHPSVQVLGHRNDVPELMRKSDVLVLPSIEEGFGLVVAEAIGSGCVPLISDACTDICDHMLNGLVHNVGDVEMLKEHITLLHENRSLLKKLRNGTLELAPKVTWDAAGYKLYHIYKNIVKASKN